MEGYDTSDGACAAHGPDRADFPAQEPGLEDALYRAIREAGSGSGAGKEQFVRLGRSLAMRVARYLLRKCPGLLDPAMADRGASVEEVAEVILELWYEVLFSDSAGWRRVSAPAPGRTPSAYLWQIAKRQLLREDAGNCASLEPDGELSEDAIARRWTSKGRLTPRAVRVPEDDAWAYVRMTDGLSQCADSIAQEVLDEDYYPVFQDRVWGAGDDGKRVTYREIGERHGISEEAARKRFQRAEARIRRHASDHPEDPRVQELERYIWVDGLRMELDE